MPKSVQPRRGDIFMADLARDPLTRQSGVRPVVIIQNDQGNMNSSSVIAVIVTSSHKKMPTHVPLFPRHGVKRPSTALCEHIITIEKSCLLNHLGTIVNTDAERQLDCALRVSIGLKA